ncbi:hypothetical protein KKA39_02590 [Patescibacteria group bacterium]|nr:hypothetical protein [Patescibacteria group bacterium]MBU1728164.1 hypothetical protein [Patescibacteria group bacterium]
MDYNDDELMEEKSFRASDTDDIGLGDDIDDPLGEDLEPLDGVELEDDDEYDPDSNFH